MWALVVAISLVLGFPPPLRTIAAELRRDLAEARSAKAGNRTVPIRVLLEAPRQAATMAAAARRRVRQRYSRYLSQTSLLPAA